MGMAIRRFKALHQIEVGELYAGNLESCGRQRSLKIKPVRSAHAWKWD